MNCLSFFSLLVIGTATFTFSLSWAMWSTKVLKDVRGESLDFLENDQPHQNSPPGIAIFFLEYVRFAYIIAAMFSLYSVAFYYHQNVNSESQRNLQKSLIRSLSVILMVLLQICWVVLLFLSAFVLMVDQLEAYYQIEFFTKVYLIVSSLITALGGIVWKIYENKASSEERFAQFDLEEMNAQGGFGV